MLVNARLSASSCDDVEPLLLLGADGELLDDDRATLSAHLAGCPACRARMDAAVGLKAALRASAADVELPPALQLRIRSSLHEERRRAGLARLGRRAAVAAVGVVACAVVVVAVLGQRNEPAIDAGLLPVSSEALLPLLERHALDVPVDVASPDPNRVAQFLGPRVGRAVRVPRLDDSGFGLFGARVVDLHERRVAQLVYRGGLGQRVTLIDLPDADGRLAERMIGARAFSSLEQAGHRLRVWRSNGAVHALVADLDGEGLERLANAIER